MNITKTIGADTVVISPVFNGGCEPRFWEVSVNDRVMWKTFASPKQALRFVESLYGARTSIIARASVFAPFLSDV